MTIWVDADACPNVIKDMLFRAARRTGIELTLVANQFLQVPGAANIKSVQVPGGFDVADHYISERVAPKDLVITADIPLAAEVVEKAAIVVTPRGELLNANTIRQRLSMRNFMEELRNSGVDVGGPKAMSESDKRDFASCLDRYLAGSLR